MLPIHSCPLRFRQILSESTPDRPQRDNSPELGSRNLEKSLTWGEGASPEGESDAAMRLSCAILGKCSDSPRALVTGRKKSGKEYVLKNLLQMREVKAWELNQVDEEIAKLRALECADASSSCSTQTPHTASSRVTQDTSILFTPGRPHAESDDEHDGIVCGNNSIENVEVELFGDDE